MPFSDNSTLITTATVLDLGTDSTNNVYDGSAGATAFMIHATASGSDTIVGFGTDDSIISDHKIFDGNNDGYIAFGPNGVLDADRTSSKNAGDYQIAVGGTGDDRVLTIRYLGTKSDGNFAYASADTRDQLLGHFTKGFGGDSTIFSGGDSSVAGTTYRYDSLVGDDTFDAGKGATAILFDNGLGLNLGGDTVNNFGKDDLLIFTSKLYDSDNNGVVTFAGNKVLDVSSQNPAATDPNGGPGGQIDTNGVSHDVLSVTFLGEKTIGGVDYYYYGSASHAPIDGGLASA